MALAAACLGFLPFNLAGPARIFLGDGGSTPIGLAVAGLIMVNPANSAQWTDLLAAVPLVGIPILDTAMVVFSRQRRSVNVLSGARDHTTHRLLAVLGTPRRVALALGAAQLALCALGIALYALSMAEIVLAAIVYTTLGCAAIAALDGLGWIPGRGRTPAPAAEELSA
jgi:UDP-GlcNAc:undecaprenyl-phosphate GlcNAc-1-phosphate transferase